MQKNVKESQIVFEILSISHFEGFHKEKYFGLLLVAPVESEAVKDFSKMLNVLRFSFVKTKEGETIDCIDRNKQPSLDHPLLKNHKIQVNTHLYSSIKGMYG